LAAYNDFSIFELIRSEHCPDLRRVLEAYSVVSVFELKRGKSDPNLRRIIKIAITSGGFQNDLDFLSTC
jgi:hypothetical protein